MIGCWSAISTFGDTPPGRSSTSVGVINRKLYAFSGEHTPRAPVDGDVFELDVDTQIWRRIRRESGWPPARVGHAGVVHGGQLYIYGGRTSADEAQTMSDFWCFNPQKIGTSDVWTSLSLTGTPPPPLSYHSMASDSQTLYIFGGCTPDHGRSNHIWEFDLQQQRWEQLTPAAGQQRDGSEPEGRGGASIVHASDGLHVLFGYNGKEELADHWLWNKQDRRWDRLTSNDGPPARSVTDVVFVRGVGAKGSLFVFGGEYTPSAQGHEGAGSYHRDAWLFDIASSTWSSAVRAGDSAPSARGWFSSVALGEEAVLVYGGFDGKERVGDVHKWSVMV